MNSIVIQAWRVILDQCLRYCHWWAVAGILAIIVYDHPTPYTIIGGGGLFIYFLLKRKAVAFSFLVVFLLSWANVLLQSSSQVLPKNQTNWVVTVQTIPNIDGDHLTMDVMARDKVVVRGIYRIKTKQEKEDLIDHLFVGMTCQVKGSIEKPQPPSNFNAFNYSSYLKHNGITYFLQIETIANCHNQELDMISRIKRMRQNGIQMVNQTFSSPINGITNALVFGDRTYMSPDVLQAYQTLGLVHLLAVSGLHVGIVIALCYISLLRIGFVKEHVHLILLFCIIPLYAVLTGLSPSVLRASLMIGLALLGTIFKTKPPPLSILGMACLILLFVNPEVVFDIGFELSFLIAFSIVISAPTIQKRYKNRVIQTFMMTSIAQTAALPIILFHFYSISLLSFLLNLIFIPFISLIILPLAILTVILMVFSPYIAQWFVHLLSWMVIPAHDLLLACQNMLTFNVVTGRPNDIEMVFLVVGVITILVLWEKWNHPLSVFLPICFIFVIGLAHYILQLASPYGSVTFLDVGQGDSILIQLPHRQGVMLIDTGGKLPFIKPEWQTQRDPYDIGKDVVAVQMKAEGISKINWLVLTHRDMDHIGGLKGLMGKVTIENIILSDFFQESETEKEWFRRARSLGIHIQRVPVGTTWGSGQLKVLWPFENKPTSNNRSLVLFARLGGENWLFTGDLEKEGERGLMENYPQLHVDILKVGHHGSHTSSSPAFIEKVKPKLAVISVGANNRFGHPHPDVLKTLEENNVAIVRTDQSGAIKIMFSDKQVISILKAKQ
jgi:competence protein ComEC